MIAAFKARCRQAAIRITPQRIAVYNALLNSDDHPSAESLYRQVRKEFPNISLDTVNRTLLTLAEIDAARIIPDSGDARRFDGNLAAHQHFICVKCKRIVDFQYQPLDNIPVPATISSRFAVLRQGMIVEGICDLCRSQ